MLRARTYRPVTPFQYLALRKALLLLGAVLVKGTGITGRFESMLIPGERSMDTAPAVWTLLYVCGLLLAVWTVDAALRLLMRWAGFRVLPSLRGVYLLDHRRAHRDPDDTADYVVRHTVTGAITHSSSSYDDIEAWLAQHDDGSDS